MCVCIRLRISEEASSASDTLENDSLTFVFITVGNSSDNEASSASVSIKSLSLTSLTPESSFISASSA